jgi:hypothetical protein
VDVGEGSARRALGKGSSLKHLGGTSQSAFALAGGELKGGLTRMVNRPTGARPRTEARTGCGRVDVKEDAYFAVDETH